MNRKLITETPINNTEYILNFTKVVNGEVFLRDATGHEDISLVNYCKDEYKNLYGTEITADVEEFGEFMDDDSLLSNFYWMAVGHAELRLRLKQYEDAGLSPDDSRGE